MKFNSPYFTTTDKMQALQRWILVHSMLYYEFNETIVNDEVYDKNMYQLRRLIERYERFLKLTRFGYAFKDFDPSSGYYLISRLSEIDKNFIFEESQRVLRTVKHYKTKKI